MPSPFDQSPNRRRSESIKWNYFSEDVLPMWVADMDFYSPEAVNQALQNRVEHGVYGYATSPVELSEVITARMEQLHQWRISPDDLVFLPGVIVGFNLAAHALAQPGAGLMIQTPVYMPFLKVAANAGMLQQEMELTQDADGSYAVDMDRFHSTIQPDTRMFLMSNPHNPVGRVFSPDELLQMAELCLQNRTVICSDEIHSDLIYSGHKHTPIASLDPEIAANTITLMAPSKTFNIPGLKCAFAIVQNSDLRKKFQQARQGLVGDVNLMGYQAALAAYRHGSAWLSELLVYLEGNRDYLQNAIEHDFPGMHMCKPEGTYLAWIDCRNARIGNDPCQYFLDHARVGLNNGSDFGNGGEGFVRLNFGCPRSTLEEGLTRMQLAMERLQKA